MNGPVKVLWLCKARYMNYDVIDDRYARLFEIPQQLGRWLSVQGFCLDYRLRGSSVVPPDLQGRWQRSSVPGTLFLGWFFVLLGCVRRTRPDCIIASSDCLQVILGALLARLYGTCFIADLYDDYAEFGLARIPGVRWLYRRSLARADAITVVSETLGEDVGRQYPKIPVLLLESTVDAERFQQRERAESLQRLGLEDITQRKLVGVCGGLNRYHGAGTVFDAFEAISAENEDVVFVVAGRLFEDCPLPRLPNVRYLGMLPHDQMSYFFSALDVAVVALSNTRFGYYAFPQKAYEVLSCRVPVVAADVGALARLFKTLPGVLYDADSPASFARRVQEQLAGQQVLDIAIPTWSGQAEKLAGLIGELLPGATAGR